MGHLSTDLEHVGRMSMTYKHYGKGPVRVVVVHGGPGCAGEVAPLARDIADMGHSVLEPFQTGLSIEEQVDELRRLLLEQCAPPVAFVGWSWGVWLVCFLAEQQPALVRQLILVGSGPFLAKDAETIKSTRLARLNDKDRAQYERMRENMDAPGVVNQLMPLFDKMDSVDPLPMPGLELIYNAEVHRKVWAEAVERRNSGELLMTLANLRCPVLAVHGDADPHPAQGVRAPLEGYCSHAEFVELPQCGHKPWAERQARTAFFGDLAATPARLTPGL